MASGMHEVAGPYSVHAGHVQRDRATVLGIWKGNLGREDHLEAKYDWFYARCPWGEPIVRLLHHDATQEWVGAAAIGRRRMRWNGREIRAGVLVDMAVVPRHRTLGPALLLQRELFGHAMQEFDLVYGFPNVRAVPVVKRVGYVKLTDIVRYTCVLRHAPYLQRHMPRPVAALAGWALDLRAGLQFRVRAGAGTRRSAAWRATSSAELASLGSSAGMVSGLVAERDGSLLRWRFDEAPRSETRYLVVSSNGEVPTAWFACHFDSRVLHVQDFCGADGPQHHIDPVSGTHLVEAARALGAISVSVQHAGSDEAAAAWQSAGFVERARRPVYGYWNPALGDVPDAAAIHLTAADEDE